MKILLHILYVTYNTESNHMSGNFTNDIIILYIYFRFTIIANVETTAIKCMRKCLHTITLLTFQSNCLCSSNDDDDCNQHNSNHYFENKSYFNWAKQSIIQKKPCSKNKSKIKKI